MRMNYDSGEFHYVSTERIANGDFCLAIRIGQRTNCTIAFSHKCFELVFSKTSI